MRLPWKRSRAARRITEIAPEDIFIDSSNLPDHNAQQFEGRVERPVTRRSVYAVGVVFLLVVVGFGTRAFNLQIVHGASYRDTSENNTLDREPIFATRGVVYDRTGREIAWNAPQATSTDPTDQTSTSTPYALRRYADMPGLAHILGFVRYPRSDAQGNWWQTDYTGVSGVEKSFDGILKGTNGSYMFETDAHGKVQRQDIIAPPQEGTNLTLSIDADVQSELYKLLWQHAKDNNFKGGAAIIMDVRTGEVLAITSFPEYDNIAFTNGDSKIVTSQSSDASTPILDRAISGLYAPGSIVKPIFAAAALNERLISPDKQIDSVGQITIPNPYDPKNPSVFRDWRVHGWVDMRTAIAVSSDEYFYTIGGGYGGQQGLGIARLDEYARMFGLGSTTGIALLGEEDGNIPTPQWKAQVFGAKDPWRIGDTYHTAIGQYGFQVTPIQAVRYVAAIANGGTLFTPQIIASSTAPFTQIPIPDSDLQIVREGMRLAVTSDRPDATVKSLYIGDIHIAAKTGTAQIGTHNQWMNSWSVGFWPADHPHYAYAVVLEHAPAGTASGAAPGMLPFFQWLAAKHPEYVDSTTQIP